MCIQSRIMRSIIYGMSARLLLSSATPVTACRDSPINIYQKIEFTRSLPAVAPAPKIAALPNLAPSLLAHCECCVLNLGVVRICRMIRVLSRLRQSRRIDVILSLGKAWINILRRSSSGLLSECQPF